MVSVLELDKVELLKRLWLSAPKSLFSEDKIGLNNPQAERAVCEYVDIFCGRKIQCFLNHSVIDPVHYERGIKPGTFARIVNEMRQSNSKSTTPAVVFKCANGKHVYREKIVFDCTNDKYAYKGKVDVGIKTSCKCTSKYNNDWYMQCLSDEESLWIEFENLASDIYADESDNMKFHWVKLRYSPLNVWSYFNNDCNLNDEKLMKKYYEVHVRFPHKKRATFYPLLIHFLFKPGFKRDCWTYLMLSNHTSFDEDDIDRLPLVTFYVFGKIQAEYLLKELHLFMRGKFDLTNDVTKLKPMIFEDYPFGVDHAISCAGGSRDEKFSVLNFLLNTFKKGKLQEEYKFILDKIVNNEGEYKHIYKGFQKFFVMDGKYFNFQTPIKIPRNVNLRYKTTLCENWLKHGCMYKSYCLFSHGASELNSSLCLYWIKGNCTNGERCTFSHNANLFLK